MTLPYIPPRAERSTGVSGIRSVTRFRAQYRRGTLTALTGQAATLTRASTGTILDSNGATITVGHSMPRFESRTWTTDPAIGLRLAADDLTYPCEWVPERGTLYVSFAEAGTRTTANAGLAYIGNDAVSGARLILDSTGTNYRATIHNGTTSVSVTAASATPTTGQPCHALLQLDDDGMDWRIRLILDVPTATGDEWTAWSSTIARAATWGSGAKARANRTGSGGTQGSTWLRDWGWWPGLVTLADVQGAL